MDAERFQLESPDAHPRPPEPTGRELARFERRGHAGAPDALLRLALDEYQGKPYLSLRVFEADRDGRGWWPTKKGVSVRIGEARGLAMALMQAVDRLDQAERRSQGRPHRRDAYPPATRQLEPPYTARTDFDEFSNPSPEPMPR